MTPLDRNVPWNARADIFDTGRQRLLAIHEAHHPDEDQTPITRAFDWAYKAHAGQSRKSGEPYIAHPIEVACIVGEQGLDANTIAAAILHDSVEDTDVTLGEIESSFGAEVAAIIDGCTKVDRLNFDTKEQQQAATVRKLLVAVAKDIRVLIIKLADRLHNMSTLAVLPEFKQQRTAGETMHVFAPLAHRLGMSELKSQLQDLSFAALHPRWYAEIDEMVAQRAPERDAYLAQLLGDVQARLEENAISAHVIGRSKHLWSIYEKMVVNNIEFDAIYDLVGVRVICASVRECYGAIGCIHGHWRPVQGRFKDYIAMPKFNLYQSLHTTVAGPGGKMVEFQVRTIEMDARAERGMAAHWAYKDNLPAGDLAWLNRIVGMSDDASDPTQFMESLRTDLEQEEVAVFTPKGRIVTLPVGATPVDFAYAIHTEVGNGAVGASVNKRMVGLDHKLATGDVVEVFTSKQDNSAPSQEWLRFVVTQRAISHIRRWYNRERQEDLLAQAKEDLADALREVGLPVRLVLESETLTEIGSEMGYSDPEVLYNALANGHVTIDSVVGRALRRLQDLADSEEHLSASTYAQRTGPAADRHLGVHVEGFDDVLIRLARCCNPVPPDDISAFATRGRGVAVHRSDCANAVPRSEGGQQRFVDAQWILATGAVFVASIEIRALDRRNLLMDVAQVLADQRVNAIAADMRARQDRVTVMHFDIELGNTEQISRLLRRLRQLEGIYSAERVTNQTP